MVLPLPNRTRKEHALVCDAERLMVPQRHPSAEESAVIEEYRIQYRNAFGYDPWGVHIIPSCYDGLAVWYAVTQETLDALEKLK